jgi:hypothetical protein
VSAPGSSATASRIVRSSDVATGAHDAALSPRRLLPVTFPGARPLRTTQDLG